LFEVSPEGPRSRFCMSRRTTLSNGSNVVRKGGTDPPVVNTTESLILAQNERWRRGLGMQVERESRRSNTKASKVANG